MFVLLNSVPKAGTHLLASVVREMGGFGTAPFSINRKIGEDRPAGPDDILVGIGDPLPLALHQFKARLSSLADRSYVTGHIPHDARTAQAIRDLGGTVVMIQRDPLDIALSLIEYILRQPDNHFHRALSAIPAERHWDSIMQGFEVDGVRLLGVPAQVDSAAGWNLEPDCLSVSFEALVGPRGGGSAESQQTALRAIADHIGAGLSKADLHRVAERTFGAGPTFSVGRIGRGRQAFSKLSP